MKNLSAGDVKKFALEHGADLVGIAPIERFDGAAPHLHPAKTMLPSAESIVVVACRIPRGCYRGVQEGTNWTSYVYCDALLQHRGYMHKLLYEVACFLESCGYEAVPSQGGGAHFKLAAMVAGLGQIGWHQLLLTPEFGPRQRLGIVATEAKLEPDSTFEGKLCDPEDCGYRCVVECPHGAIPKEKRKTVKVAGRTVEFSDLNLERCIPNCIALSERSPFMAKDLPNFNVFNIIRSRGGMLLSSSLYSFPAGRKTPVGRGDIFKPSSGGVIDCYHMLFRQLGLPFMAFRSARGCMEACIEYLEEKGKISGYKHPFRRRPASKI